MTARTGAPAPIEGPVSHSNVLTVLAALLESHTRSCWRCRPNRDWDSCPVGGRLAKAVMAVIECHDLERRRIAATGGNG